MNRLTASSGFVAVLFLASCGGSPSETEASREPVAQAATSLVTESTTLTDPQDISDDEVGQSRSAANEILRAGIWPTGQQVSIEFSSTLLLREDGSLVACTEIQESSPPSCQGPTLATDLASLGLTAEDFYVDSAGVGLSIEMVPFAGLLDMDTNTVSEVQTVDSFVGGGDRMPVGLDLTTETSSAAALLGLAVALAEDDLVHAAVGEFGDGRPYLAVVAMSEPQVAAMDDLATRLGLSFDLVFLATTP